MSLDAEVARLHQKLREEQECSHQSKLHANGQISDLKNECNYLHEEVEKEQSARMKADKTWEEKWRKATSQLSSCEDALHEAETQAVTASRQAYNLEREVQ
eukprot:Sspe_Gene.103342::Locus_79151_Transcript_1_1_Confidence_1.000_Length_585::g.103342::m.103342